MLRAAGAARCRRRRRSTKPNRRAWCTCAERGSSFAIRWSAPPSTKRRRSPSGRPSTARSRPCSTVKPTPIAAPGTAPRQASRPTRPSVEELEQAAERARRRSGFAAASLAFERAAALTADEDAEHGGSRQRRRTPGSRARRAGLMLLEAARPLVSEPIQRADIDRFLGLIEMTRGCRPTRASYCCARPTEVGAERRRARASAAQHRRRSPRPTPATARRPSRSAGWPAT